MIKVKKSQIHKKENKNRSDLIKKFSALNICKTVDKWIVPIYTKTYYPTNLNSIPLQQTSIYSYLGNELIQVNIKEDTDLKIFLKERFGLSSYDKYKIYELNNIIFIYLFDNFSIKDHPNYSWNTMFNMFQFRQPDREAYTNPYSAILYGYFIDNIYEEWYKLEIKLQIKLQNSNETISLRKIFELCEKMI